MYYIINICMLLSICSFISASHNKRLRFQTEIERQNIEFEPVSKKQKTRHVSIAINAVPNPLEKNLSNDSYAYQHPITFDVSLPAIICSTSQEGKDDAKERLNKFTHALRLQDVHKLEELAQERYAPSVDELLDFLKNTDRFFVEYLTTKKTNSIYQLITAAAYRYKQNRTNGRHNWLSLINLAQQTEIPSLVSVFEHVQKLVINNHSYALPSRTKVEPHISIINPNTRSGSQQLLNKNP